MHAGKLRSSPIRAITALKQNGTFLTALAMMVQQLPQFHKLNKGRRRETKAPIKNRAINFLFPFFFLADAHLRNSHFFAMRKKGGKRKNNPEAAAAEVDFPNNFCIPPSPSFPARTKYALKSHAALSPPFLLACQIEFVLVSHYPSLHIREKRRKIPPPTANHMIPRAIIHWTRQSQMLLLPEARRFFNRYGALKIPYCEQDDLFGPSKIAPRNVSFSKRKRLFRTFHVGKCPTTKLNRMGFLKRESRRFSLRFPKREN